MEKEYPGITLEKLPALARALSEALVHSLVCLQGPMGVGKTTLVRALCQARGVQEPVASPSYALVNEYQDGQGRPIYHFDWYRLEQPEEALDLGLDHYLAQDALCLMEWPEKISTFLPPAYDLLELSLAPDQSRTLRHKILPL